MIYFINFACQTWRIPILYQGVAKAGLKLKNNERYEVAAKRGAF